MRFRLVQGAYVALVGHLSVAFSDGQEVFLSFSRCDSQISSFLSSRHRSCLTQHKVLMDHRSHPSLHHLDFTTLDLFASQDRY